MSSPRSHGRAPSSLRGIGRCPDSLPCSPRSHGRGRIEASSTPSRFQIHPVRPSPRSHGRGRIEAPRYSRAVGRVEDKVLHGLMAVAALKPLMARDSLSAVVFALHGLMAVAALKPQTWLSALPRGRRRSPRSHGRGRIEASSLGVSLSLAFDICFPRSHGRGRIEAHVTCLWQSGPPQLLFSTVSWPWPH